jgi:hypothetical protein
MKYIIQVTKPCSATLVVEAETLEEAKEKAEYYKYNMYLDLK